MKTKSYIKFGGAKNRKTTTSEDDVLKEPQINFQNFGSMSDSESESAHSQRNPKKSSLSIKTGNDA